MKSLPRPAKLPYGIQIDSSIVVDECVDGMRSTDKAIAVALKPQLKGAAETLEAAWDAGPIEVAKIDPAEMSSGSEVNDNVVRGLFSRRFKRMGGRNKQYNYYLSIKGNRLCCYCEIDRAKDLDHSLPQKHFPYLSITPINLVPCCGTCNAYKLDVVPSDEFSIPFNPYFDSYCTAEWLNVEIKEECVPGLFPDFIFSVRASIVPEGEQPEENIDYRRLSAMFDILHLGKQYNDAVKIKFDNNRGYFKSVMHSSDGVRGLLQEMISARKKLQEEKLDWEALAYQAALDSEWFCSTGVQLWLSQPTRSKSSTK